MTVVHLWGRRVREARETTDRLVAETRSLEKDVARKVEQVNVAAVTTEAAAVAILEGNEKYLRAAVRARQ